MLEASATGLDFDGVPLTQSARRSVKLTNGGDEALELGDTVLSPAGEGFTIANSDCAATTLLAGGLSCTVEVEFRPPSVDVEMTAELIAAYVGAAQPLVIPLRGRGLLSGSLELSAVTAGEENFGDVLVGDSSERAFQITNPGAQPSGAIDWTTSGGFEVVTPPNPGECVPGSTSLVDGERCALRVRFAPTLREVSNGMFTINSPLAGAAGISLLGRGVVAGQLHAAPEVNFGRVLTAATADRLLVLSNVGDQPLSPPTLALSSADPEQVAAFTFESACSAPLALGEECSVTLRFAPTVAVPHAATLQLSSAGSEPTSVLLLGEALRPGSLVIAPAPGSSPDFGDVAIGASNSRSFTLTNPGAEPSGPLTITTDNNQFDVAPGDCAAGDLVDGSSCTFSVALTPTDSLTAAANVSVQSPGAGRAGIAVTGRGRQKAALAATGNRNLGRANIGQATLTAPENEFTWTVNNTGDLATGPLAVANDNFTEFVISADTCSGLTIAGKGSCVMTIRFRPMGTEQRTARITVSDPVAMLSAPLVLTGLGVQLVGPGQSCVNADCQTGQCTRAGVCCDTACDRVCEVCSATGICTAQTTRQPCGNGAACFGVDQCKLQEGSACTAVGGAQQCGSGFCERRLGGAGDGDRICCLEGCAPGLACNAQGRCEQPTAGDGAICGRAGDLPCGPNLVCKQCVGSGTGQSQCKPAAACCGTCPAGLECANGSSCECPFGANGQRGIPCADGCITRQAGACCTEAPACDPGDRCDPFDHSCKECLTGADCQGRACNGGTCQAPQCAPNQRQCFNGVPQLCAANGLYQNQDPCRGADTCNPDTGLCEAPPRGLGDACPDGNCDEGICSAGICCNRDCQAPCESCSTGTCRILSTSSQCSSACDPVFADGPCTEGPLLPLPPPPAGEGLCGTNGQCALIEDRCPHPRGEGARCLSGGGGVGTCLGAEVQICEPTVVLCAASGTLSPAVCAVGLEGGGCCINGTDAFACGSGCGAGIQARCDSDEDCVGSDVCCYFPGNNVVTCSSAATCEQPLCSSPVGGANTACSGNQACIPLPGTSASAGWSACGNF